MILGVLKISNYGSDVDFDNLKTGCGYVTTGNYGLSYGFYLGIFRDGYVGTQFFVQDSQGLYVRGRGSQGWTAWRRAAITIVG